MKNNQFKFINEVYFGALNKDKTVNYLPREYCELVEDIITRNCLVEVLVETQKRCGDVERVQEGKHGRSIILSHEDPDHCHYMSSLFHIFEVGVLTEFRRFVKAESRNPDKKNRTFFKGDPGSLTAGDLIHELIETNYSELEEFWKPFNEGFRLTYDKQRIEQAYEKLIHKAEYIRDKNYYGSCIKSNEAAALHKDQMPQKRRIAEQKPIIKGGLRMNYTRFVSKFRMEPHKMTECLNEYAKLFCLYKAIMPPYSGIDFSHSMRLDTLEDYIRNTFSLFTIGIPQEIIQKNVEQAKKCLKPSLELISWT